jgi:TetR/AcrR family transcriptional regulator
MTELLAENDDSPGRLRRLNSRHILQAAAIIFAAKGFDGATTADIAAQAGLPKANVHYYFGTKEKIYRAVLEDILKLWLGEADHWITADRPPRQALEGYIRAKLMLSKEKPEASRIYANELLRGAPQIKFYLHFALRERVTTLSGVINGWVAAERLRPVDPAHLLFCLWAMTQTYADFAVQIGAVLDKPQLDADVFETAAQTITAMVLGSLLIGETT